MGHLAKIICDSVSMEGVRLTTFEIVFPRIVLAEFNTHRVFSRNSASSRAIPVEKMIKMVEDNPYIPTHWGKNQKGMSADQEVGDFAKVHAESVWLRARDRAVEQTRILLDFGIHKQITNRLMEPFMWHTVVVTATEWSNFWHLRDHPDAHPEIQKIAHMMRELYEEIDTVGIGPNVVEYGDWHLPYVNSDDWKMLSEAGSGREESLEMLKRVSAGRCAAVSYMRQNVAELVKDAQRCETLISSAHMSPLEHPATPLHLGTQSHSNYRGWMQFRKYVPNEHDALGAVRSA